MKKNPKVVLELPPEMFTKVGDISFIKENDKSLFFQTKNRSEVVDPDGYILQNKKLHGHFVSLKVDHFKALYHVTLKEMQSLVKAMEKRDKYFKALAKKKKNPHLSGLFCIHFSPDLSFTVSSGKKR